ncbi:MAG: cobyric acid synthase [Lachnospiraceae bacterium]|nr:cobyric acid synthase [Lachnospiraceae bacterium]
MREDTVIKTESLSIGYDHELIKDISLRLTPGCIMSLIGPNGSGKSTLLKTLTGQLKKKGGVVYLKAEDMDACKGTDIAKLMSMVDTSRNIPELMSCREIVEMGRYPYTGMLGILSEEDRVAVKNALEMTDTADIADRPFSAVSDGQRQRIMLARAICQDPEILILDEPTSYLDIRFKLQILDIIRRLSEEKQVAVLMSLHELEQAMRISHQVVAIGKNGVERIGTPREVFEESFIRSLYGIEGMDMTLTGAVPWFEDVKAKKTPINKARGVIMIQGTMSAAGKSLIAAGLCRVFARAGYKVMPFKSQNMALNSFVTREGLEMGRAQAMQAECCMREPLVCMNPVLLKPTDDKGSQVIVNGRVIGNMRAVEYFRYKTQLIPEIKKAFDKCREMSDIVVIEGAGSPVEINLKKNDIVNMGLAEMTGAAVLLVGDIDRGGVFAQLIGTLDLLTTEERERVGGLIVNKFRGDIKLFEDGVKILEERSGKKVIGVVPFTDVNLEDEDSLSGRFDKQQKKDFDIAVIRLAHISNFTDFDVFEQSEDISVRYVTEPSQLGKPDILMIPGTKNTIADLRRLKEQGFDEAICAYAASGGVVIGICGGYQILGRKISDPDSSECGGEEEGLGLLPVDTVMSAEKTRTQFEGSITGAQGILKDLCGKEIRGYEIHMGVSVLSDSLNGEVKEFTSAATGYCTGNVYGTYVHGVFDAGDIAAALTECVAAAHGKSVDTASITDYRSFKETQYEKLADVLEESLDMQAIYEMMGITRVSS